MDQVDTSVGIESLIRPTATMVEMTLSSSMYTLILVD
jgi:hypothetical protein